jgi:transcriptional regulator with XRE-family HTH domain
MKEKRLSSAGMLALLRCTDGNERVSRPTLSKLVSGSYGATPSVTVVRGLAQALNTTTDYLLGLSDEPQPGAMAFFRRYGLASEEQLLILLGEQNKELADIMRAVRDIPDEEQAAILQHIEEEVAFVRSLRLPERIREPIADADRYDLLTLETHHDHRNT